MSTKTLFWKVFSVSKCLIFSSWYYRSLGGFVKVIKKFLNESLFWNNKNLQKKEAKLVVQSKFNTNLK